MKIKLLGLLFITLMLGTAVSNAADVSFTDTDPAEGSLVANCTVDVIGGFAISGTGTVTSTLFPAPENLTLLTGSSTLPAGGGSINDTGILAPSGFTWHTVPNSGGADGGHCRGFSP